MNKKTRQKNVKGRAFISKGMIVGIGAAAVIISVVVYFWVNSLIPVNGNSPVFAAPTNTFMKASYSPQSGYVFTSQSTSSARRSIGVGYNSPAITLRQGELESIHIINEDTSSKHNFNIDAFKEFRIFSISKYYVYCKQSRDLHVLLYHTSRDERHCDS